ncbi:MAG TPA: 16S rRNA (guanine(966)-N(2))-methyltransferase RsmD [Gemmatimonadaceae bacterium]|nr:16S rRNA (guanine(966)-N(2))-methyltransferase RsmD [Gemmatimonadaceae bacterium]
MPELRIVGGQWRGRRIKVPPGHVRPTADRVREAWMSIVLPALDGARVVDLCAGSGALGLEALSRGAVHCDFVEKSSTVRRVLADNIATLGASDRATVHGGSALKAIDESAALVTEMPWDVAFADPPYNEGQAVALAERWLRAPFAAIFGVEHESSITLPPHADGRESDRRRYGITALTFYRLNGTS